MKITALTWQCYQVELLVEHALGTIVLQNTKNPLTLIANCMSGSFYLISAMMAQFANMNYEDWFSFAYYLGDIFYRVFVVDKKYFFE